jgi:hypothetical protein
MYSKIIFYSRVWASNNDDMLTFGVFMSFIKTTTFTFFLGASLFSFHSEAFARTSLGGDSGGGGDLKKNNIESIKLLIKGNGLKKTMLKYLAELDASTIEDDFIQKSLTDLLKNNDLQKDITNSRYVVTDSCLDSFHKNVHGSTTIGKRGGDICFDLGRISSELKGLSENEQVNQLASLAIHEHVHHFQNKKVELKLNEEMAYKISAFIKNSAKITKEKDGYSFVADNSYYADDLQCVESVLQISQVGKMLILFSSSIGSPDVVALTDHQVLAFHQLSNRSWGEFHEVKVLINKDLYIFKGESCGHRMCDSLTIQHSNGFQEEFEQPIHGLMEIKCQK